MIEGPLGRAHRRPSNLRSAKHGRHKEKSRSYTKLTKMLQRCIHLFNWRPSGEGTPPPFNLCSAYSFRSAKGSMQSETGDCMRTKSWRLALQGIVPKWYWFAYMLGYRNMCCMSFRFWSTECGEHFCTKWGQMRCKKVEISLRSHAIKPTMLNVASEKGL